MSTEIKTNSASSRVAWNKGHLVGQKRPLRPKEVWAIRVRLQIKHRKRDLAMFMSILESFIANYPETADKTYGLALSAILRRAFPCAPT